jgi:hypothetical protein
MGKPVVKSWSVPWRRYVEKLPRASDNTTWTCDYLKEMAAPPSARAKWLELRTSCKAAHRNLAGKLYSEKSQGFIGPGSGITDPDAYAPTIGVEPKQITTTVRSSPVQVAPAISGPATVSAEPVSKEGYSPMETTVSGVGTSIGGVDVGFGPGGINVGGIPIPGTGGWGKSKCPGPYNFNPVTGGCDPKPGAFAGTPSCPDGYVYDTASGQCKKTGVVGAGQRWIPGGETGFVASTGWASTTAYGTQGVVPQSRPSMTLTCPRGYVLYGREPGMEVCMPKGLGLPNKMRKWPKTATPALSGQDMKTLRRIGTLQKRIKRVAQIAGYKGMKL